MQPLEPKSFPHLDACDALSKASIATHLSLYTGYVNKYNELIHSLGRLQQLGPAAIADMGSLKGDITFALGAIKNHELFFDSLGVEGNEPGGDLLALIVKSFHSLPRYLVDLKQTALQTRGWAWTAYDLDQRLLFNYDSGSQNGLPVWNTIPLLALDLYGHAYFYDFGNDKIAYVEATMKSLNWLRIATRLAWAQSIPGPSVPVTP